jgi:hypothetical protein
VRDTGTVLAVSFLLLAAASPLLPAIPRATPGKIGYRDVDTGNVYAIARDR